MFLIRIEENKIESFVFCLHVYQSFVLIFPWVLHKPSLDYFLSPVVSSPQAVCKESCQEMIFITLKIRDTEI